MPARGAKKRTQTRKRLPSLRGLRERAWTAWSIHIRKSQSDWRGWGRCYTCGVVKDYKELQAGHFLHGVLDYDRRNIHPQCVKCNHYQDGNLAKYATRLVAQYGSTILTELEQAAGRRGNHYSREELNLVLSASKSGSWWVEPTPSDGQTSSE